MIINQTLSCIRYRLVNSSTWEQKAFKISNNHSKWFNVSLLTTMYVQPFKEFFDRVCPICPPLLWIKYVQRIRVMPPC